MKKKASFININVMIAFMLLVMVSFVFFSAKVTQITSNVSNKHLEEIAKNSASHLQSTIALDTKFLQGAAERLAGLEGLVGAQARQVLEELSVYAHQLELVICPAGEKQYYTAQGVLSQENTITIWEKSAVVVNAAGVRMAVSVPIVRGGQTVGTLLGIYPTDLLCNYLSVELFEGEGMLGVGVISQAKMLDVGSPMILEGARFDPGYSVEQLQSDLAEKKSGYTLYSIEEEKIGVYYQPLGIDQWYLTAAVPVAHMGAERQKIEEAASALLAVLIIAFGAIIAFTIWQGRVARNVVEEERRFYQQILNAIPVPLFITDLQKKLIFVNDAVYTYFNKKQEDLIGQACSIWCTPICGTRECSIDKLEREGDSLNYFDLIGKSFQVNTAHLWNNQHQKDGYIEVLQDITEVVQIHHALEEKTKELMAITENLEGGVVLTKLDEQFSILKCNRYYQELTGMSEEDIIGTSAAITIAPSEQVQTVAEIHRQLEQTGFVALEHRICNLNGQEMWVSLRGRTIQLGEQRVGVWLLSDIGVLKAAEEKIRINEELYRLAIANTEDIIIEYDFSAHIMSHTAKAMEYYGISTRVENAPESLIVPQGPIQEESKEEFLRMFQRMENGSMRENCVVRCKQLDGTQVWNRFAMTVITNNKNHATRAVGVIQNITSEMQQREMYEKEVRYRDITMRDTMLYYEVDLSARRFIKGQDLIAKITGRPVSDDYDTVVQMLLDGVVYEEDRPMVAGKINAENLERLAACGIYKETFQYRRNRLSGEPGWVECTIHMFEENDGTRGFCYVKDIDESKLVELELRARAERDLLTGVFNKMTCEMLVRQYVNRKDSGCGAFMIIDLDNFKQINDTQGHAAGDRVLAEVASRLTELFHTSDIVGRIGGDEFLVFMKDCNKVESVLARANSICTMFRDRPLGGKECRVSASVGISLFPEHADSFEKLYQKADIALYHSKWLGKDVYSLFDQNMNRQKLKETGRAYEV